VIVQLVKGHGTRNDFLLLPDLDGEIALAPAAVRALCDRRAGIGADGVLRVVRTDRDPDAKEFADDAEFFMDYRNADGSLAEMCGNGLRVFFAYLQRLGVVEASAAVATRGGIRRVRALGGGDVTVEIGLPRFLADRPIATAAFWRQSDTAASWRQSDTAASSRPMADALRAAGMALEIPNPHVVVEVADEATLDDLDLRHPPLVEPPLPAGQNVEFVVRLGPRQLRMRVHERGSGETMSCGTGICAAAVAIAHRDGLDGVEPWTVDVPGGRCSVSWRPDELVELTGPAVLVGTVDVDETWLAAAAAVA
jgi:diaminopimelate epimerase